MNKTLKSTNLAGATIELVKGDITREEVDAIVNAANEQLQHGGGVAAAISRAGGPAIQEESNLIAPVRVGQAKITSGGILPAMYVIHTVGPRWGEGEEEIKLDSAVRSALEIADQEYLETISLPAISTGIFGFPLDSAASVILSAIGSYLDTRQEGSLRKIRIVLFDNNAVKAFNSGWYELDFFG